MADNISGETAAEEIADTFRGLLLDRADTAAIANGRKFYKPATTATQLDVVNLEWHPLSLFCSGRFEELQGAFGRSFKRPLLLLRRG
jgi:hypothetical protein